MGRFRAPLLLAAGVSLGAVAVVLADEYDHRYKKGDRVDLWVNKIGPYANPQEAYEYYTLPFCAPDTRHHPDRAAEDGEDGGLFNALRSHSLGERLGGNALRHSGHDLTYPAPDVVDGATGVLEMCTTPPLTEAQVALFTTAAEDQWFYLMYLDDLPVWGMVGEMLPDLAAAKGEDFGNDLRHLEEAVAHHAEHGGEFRAYVYTKRTLHVSFNGDRIVRVDLTSEPASLVEVKEGMKLKFELDVQWSKTRCVSRRAGVAGCFRRLGWVQNVEVRVFWDGGSHRWRCGTARLYCVPSVIVSFVLKAECPVHCVDEGHRSRK